ncbi:MAG: rhomboid family intramembrane serine protease, partial [Candidatus Aenigmatarchaeota archaeon]
FFFGRVIEDNLGKKKFLLIFFLSSFVGTAAVSASVVLGWMPAGIPTIGASAAIFGLLGAAMMTSPFEMVFYPYIIPVPLVLVALLYTLYNIGAFIAVLLTGAQTEIAYAAHLGGLFAGTFFGFREEGTTHGIMVLFLIFFILLIIPFLWSILSYLEILNYIGMLSTFFG